MHFQYTYRYGPPRLPYSKDAVAAILHLASRVYLFFLAANQGKLFRRKPCFTSQPPLLFREKQRPRHSLFRESFPRLFFASWLSAFTFMFRARPVKRHRSLLSLAPLRRPSSPQPSPRSPCPPDLLRRRRKAASPEK